MSEQRPMAVKAAPKPAPVGQTFVSNELKCLFGFVHNGPDSPRQQIGPDQFDMPADSPMTKEHAKLTEVFEEMVEAAIGYNSPKVEASPAFKAILALDQALRGRLLLAAAERHIHALFFGNHDSEQRRLWQSHYAAAGVAEALIASAAVIAITGSATLSANSRRPP
jgi:hypothetical protein